MNTILLVDNIAVDLQILFKVLNKQGYKVLSAKDGATALKVSRKTIPDLILMSVQIPDLDGYSVCQQLKSNPTTQAIPIIFLSISDDASDKNRAFEVGGIDYINKPFQLQEIIVRIKSQLFLKSLKSELQDSRQKLALAHQRLKYYQKVEQQLSHEALHDGLTGLPNRTLLMDRIEQSLKQVQRNSDYLFAVLFIDLDCFKSVNDSQGHLVGDKLLIAVSKLLAQDLRETDTLARLGGDEFVILLDNIKELADATKVCDRINQRLRSPFNFTGQTFLSSVSIGIALSSTGYDRSREILRDADLAMYRAKDKGKACYEVFAQEMYWDIKRSQDSVITQI